jgi:hypothetical protein
MRRDEVEPLALLRLGYGGYRLSRLARAEMQFEASLTAAMASAMRRARCVDGEWADTCGLRWSGKALMQKCSRWVKSTRQEVSEFQMLQSESLAHVNAIALAFQTCSFSRHLMVLPQARVVHKRVTCAY